MIFIREFTPDDTKMWDEYVMEHPASSIFHMIAWKNVIEETFGHQSYYVMAIKKLKEKVEKVSSGAGQVINRDAINDNGLVSGVLPLFRVKNWFFGDYLVSLPFAVLGGAISDDQKTRDALNKHAIELAESLNCDYFELRHQEPIDGLKTKSLYFTFNRQIYQNIEENFKAIPRKQRRMIRQGKKYGLMTEYGHHLVDDFYNIVAKNFHNLGTPIFPKQFFNNFLAIFKNKADILLVKSKNGKPIAGVLTFFFKKQVLPYFAGSNLDYRKFAPNDFMYWELMKYGCKNGFEVFDFGRSKIGTGSYNFKRHWGFEPKPLNYQYHLINTKDMPDLSPANPKFKRKIKCWRKLPFTFTRILGPPISKYLT